MNIVELSCHLSFEEGLKNLKKNKPDLLFIDAMLLNTETFLQIDNHACSICIVSNQMEALPIGYENTFVEHIIRPLGIENVMTSINRAIKYNARFNRFQPATSFKDDLVTIVSLDKTDFIATKDIVFCMADGRYTTFFLLNGKKIVSCKNLGEYEKQLNEVSFYRIHHGYIINVQHITSVVKSDGVFCELNNAIKIPIAKRKQATFNRFMKERK